MGAAKSRLKSAPESEASPSNAGYLVRRRMPFMQRLHIHRTPETSERKAARGTPANSAQNVRRCEELRRASLGAVYKQTHPLYVLSIDTLLSLERMRPFEQMRDDGLLLETEMYLDSLFFVSVRILGTE